MLPFFIGERSIELGKIIAGNNVIADTVRIEPVRGQGSAGSILSSLSMAWQVFQ